MPNNNREWLKRCFNCMEPVDTPDAKCAACGWDNHDRENKDTALEQTILKGQYIVGKSLGRGGFGITYRAWDLQLQSVIAIKEYYPVGQVNRIPGTKKVIRYSGKTGDAYDKGLARFLEEALGQGQEMVMFVTEITAGADTSWFVENFGCEAYYRHNKELLFDDVRARIRRELE